MVSVRRDSTCQTDQGPIPRALHQPQPVARVTACSGSRPPRRHEKGCLWAARLLLFAILHHWTATKTVFCCFRKNPRKSGRGRPPRHVRCPVVLLGLNGSRGNRFVTRSFRGSRKKGGMSWHSPFELQDHGCLTVKLDKTEQSKTKKISVN
jgi:hypothetical protein